MADKNKSEYAKQMDSERLPDAKAEETLRLMLKKNKELREKSEISARKRFYRLAPALGALVAIAIVAVALVSRFSSGISYGAIKLSDLPIAGLSRGGETEYADFEAAFGATREALFGDWALNEIAAKPLFSGEYFAEAKLQKDAVTLDAEIYSFEPTLSKEIKSATNGIKFNKNPDTGVLSAVYQKGGAWVVLSGNTDKAAFEKAVSELAGR